MKAILFLGYPGPLGGEALAQILSGQVNPSGRMVIVTPHRAEDYLAPGTPLAPWALEKLDVAPKYGYEHGFKHIWAHARPRYPFGTSQGP